MVFFSLKEVRFKINEKVKKIIFEYNYRWTIFFLFLYNVWIYVCIFIQICNFFLISYFIFAEKKLHKNSFNYFSCTKRLYQKKRKPISLNIFFIYLYDCICVYLPRFVFDTFAKRFRCKSVANIGLHTFILESTVNDVITFRCNRIRYFTLLRKVVLPL